MDTWRWAGGRTIVRGGLAIALVAAILIGLAGGPGAAPSQATEAGPAASVDRAWVELGHDGQILARAVATGPGCPALTLDGADVTMEVRAAPDADFPVWTCELAIPAGTSTAAIDGRRLPLPVAAPRRILVIGDSGCRLKGTEVQACNDPAEWPFARVAASAAAWRPDLIVHVGDYHYRESPCPPKTPGCAGSPTGDTWASWDADFFAPAGPLLGAAPWVVVRGNHETCDRAGGGWFRLLDPRPWTAACEDYTDPYFVPAGGLRLVVVDTASSDDKHVRPDQVAAYAAQFAAANDLAGPNTWLVTHKPLWAVGHAGEEDGQEKLFRTQETLWAATGNRIAPGVRLIVSGHMHLFQTFDFADGRPPQLVAGNGGTALDPTITTPLAGLEIAGTRIVAGLTLAQFGFFTLEPAGSLGEGAWAGTLRDVDGRARLACPIQNATIRCGATSE